MDHAACILFLLHQEELFIMRRLDIYQLFQLAFLCRIVGQMAWLLTQ